MEHNHQSDDSTANRLNRDAKVSELNRALSAYEQWRTAHEYDRTCPKCGYPQLMFDILIGESVTFSCMRRGCDFLLVVPDPPPGAPAA